MPSSASLQASPTDQDPINLQYGEIGDRRLAGDLGVERLPAVQARARGVAIPRPARKSPSGPAIPAARSVRGMASRYPAASCPVRRGVIGRPRRCFTGRSGAPSSAF